MTHDYQRHGTTTLFAALNVATGEVIGQCLPRHRDTEFVKFLRTIDQQVPKDLQIHMILDNYSAHKHANVKKWLAKHPRFHLHFTPTSSSWLNLVERWFRELTDKAIRRGVFYSVSELVTAIENYLRITNENPRPYVWTATAEQILAKVARGRVALQQVKVNNETLHYAFIAAAGAHPGLLTEFPQLMKADRYAGMQGSALMMEGAMVVMPKSRVRLTHLLNSIRKRQDGTDSDQDSPAAAAAFGTSALVVSSDYGG